MGEHGNNSISLSEEQFPKTPLQVKTMMDTSSIGNSSGLLLLEQMGTLKCKPEEETKAQKGSAGRVTAMPCHSSQPHQGAMANG